MLKLLFASGMSIWACSFCALILLPNLLLAAAIPQLPWGQTAALRWQNDLPVDSDGIAYNASADGGHSAAAGPTTVPYGGYLDARFGLPYGLPLADKVLLGCQFHDAFYQRHAGQDFPVVRGTSVTATMGGKVVYAAYGAGTLGATFGRLVVIEANGYQTWYGHLSQIDVTVGQVIEPGVPLGLSGGDLDDPERGDSSGAHLHYGIRYYGSDTGAAGEWKNPLDFPGDAQYWAEHTYPYHCGP
jgi:murein DD-endopeptidase MepM/ murein hydrolase activator NlpD